MVTNKTTLVGTALLTLLGMGRAETLQCDSMVNGTCFVTTDQTFQTLDVSGDTMGVSELVIESTIRCFADSDLCTIELTDFDMIHVEGAIEGADVTVRNVKDVEVTLNGSINGNAQGNAIGTGTRPATVTGGSCRAGQQGAAHGGAGGIKYRGNMERLAPYGDETLPLTFGSGGICVPSSSGGRISITATNRIFVDGRIEENAQDWATGEGAMGSGGSILLSAPTILGSGAIRAEGGSCIGASSFCTAGGGGRIALYADDLSGMNTNQLSAAGGDSLECDEAKGLEGSVRTFCLTRTCFNGGQVKDDSSGECGCNCVAPWTGDDCQVCDRQCDNGGTLDPNSCTCSCPFGWGGVTCNECDSVDLCSGNGSCDLQQVCTCDPDYYKSDCSAYCTQEQCSSNGFCTDEGECDCIPSKVGPTCACDRLICSANSNASQAFCSGHGTCAGDQCVCDPGYFNCDCSVFCSAETTCSGHGTCTEDGSCKCENGWGGSDCSEQDVELYCFQQSDGLVNTTTGHPCLPGLHGKLGYGYNIVEDTRTVPITKLSYTQGNRFTHYLLGTYEIPDGVECEQQTVDKASTSSKTLRTFQEYRVSLAVDVGVSSGKFKNSYFSRSAEASYVYENAFQQERFYSESIRTYSLYKCRLRTV